MSDDTKVIEVIARGLVDADPTVSGHHPLHIGAKMPAARIALSAIRAAGFVVVPQEPTGEMLADMCAADVGYDGRTLGQILATVTPYGQDYALAAQIIYHAMLAAAPGCGE